MEEEGKLARNELDTKGVVNKHSKTRASILET